MNTPLGTPATTRRAVAFGLGTALLASTAALCAATPASAAPGIGWDPSAVNMDFIPTTAADGEISFAGIRNTNATQTLALSYTRDGERVQYATQFSAKDLAWSPAGDALVRVTTGGDTTIISPTTLERVASFKRGAPSLWSPFGDVLTTSARGTGATPFTSQAPWIGSNRSDTLTPASATDPGPGAPTPDAFGMVVTITPSGSTTRDLGLVDSSFPRSANPAWNFPASAPTPLGFASHDAHDAAVSNDGTLAFVGTDAGRSVLYVAEQGTGPVAVAQLGDTCAGQRPAFSPSGHSLAFVRSSGACTASELVVLDKGDSGSFIGAAEHSVVTSATLPSGLRDLHFASPSWRARTVDARRTRLGGTDRVATGIAVSRDGWADGSGGAILASSESFPDALVAGPLSGATGTPLLINPAAKLDPRVLAELKRLMPDSADRFVYIIGGTSGISSTVQNSLKSNGFQVVRLSGTDRFRTSVRVAQELDLIFGPAGEGPPRSSAFIADGMTFPDALSAGPAASTYLAPVLLTKGTTTPDVVKAYINGRTSIRTVNAIGRNAATAVTVFGSRAGDRIVGSDRYETSAKVAQRWFPGAMEVGYANGLAFPDAVTGGALMSSLGQPLMLVPATSVPASVDAVSQAFRTATDEVILFGSTAAISDGVRNKLGANAGTQTAMWGPDVPWDVNPLWVEQPGMAAGPTSGRASGKASVKQRGATALQRTQETFKATRQR